MRRPRLFRGFWWGVLFGAAAVVALRHRDGEVHDARRAPRSVAGRP